MKIAVMTLHKPYALLSQKGSSMRGVSELLQKSEDIIG